MSRWLAAATALVLAASACGRVGPPRRSHPAPTPPAASAPAAPPVLALPPGEPAPAEPAPAGETSEPKQESEK